MSQLTTLRSLVDPTEIRRHLQAYSEWIDAAALDALLDRVFLRDIQVNPSPTGDAQSWTFEIVQPQPIMFDLPVPGLSIALNPATTPGGPTVVKASASLRIPILRFIDDFDPDLIGASARGGYDFLHAISRADDAALIEAALRLLIGGNDPVQQFLDDYATHHAPLSITAYADMAAAAAALAAAMNSAGVNPVDYLFQHYIDAANLYHAQVRISLLFNDWFAFTPDDLVRLTTPQFEAALHRIDAVLSLPRWLLVPIKREAHELAGIAPNIALGEALPQPYQAEARADIDMLGFSTTLGFRTGEGVVFSLEEAEIGHTGLRLAVAGLSFDLSRSTTSSRLRAAGFTAGFVGMHARAAKVSWLPQLQLPGVGQVGISLNLRDLAIGNEGFLAAAEHSWGIDAADPLGAGSELVAGIANGWRVALVEASGEVRMRLQDQGGVIDYDWRASLAVSGLLELPFPNLLLALQFVLQLDGQQVQTGIRANLASPPLTVALDSNAQVRFDALQASGTLATDGSFTLGGSTRGALDIRAGDLPIFQGTFDIPLLTLSYATEVNWAMDGVFNATLFAGTPYSASLENLQSRLRLRADASGIVDFSLDLTGFNAELQLNEQIAISIEECVLDLNSAASPQAITDLGFDAEFIGLLAQRGAFRWQIPGAAQAFEVTLGTIAVGSGGAAFHQTWSSPGPGIALFDLLDLNVSEIDAVLVLDGDAPSHLDLQGALQIRALGSWLRGRLYLQQGPAGDQVRLGIAADQLSLDLGGAGTLAVDALEIDGSITSAGFALFGNIVGGTLALNGFSDAFSIAQSQLRFEKLGLDTRLILGLDGLEIGVDAFPGLSFGGELTLTLRGDEIVDLVLSGIADWAGIGNLDLPAFLPQPPADATLSAQLRWKPTGWQLSFRAAIEDAEPLLAMFPANLRPDVRNLEFELSAVQQHANGGFAGKVMVSLELRLPNVPGFPGSDIVRIETGDPAGWVRAIISADSAPTPAGVSSHFKLALTELVTLDVNLPGLPQTEPVVHSELDRAQLEFHSGATLSGLVEFGGNFALRPVMPGELDLPFPPPIVAKLEVLLRQPALLQLVGSATHRIQFSGDQVQVDLECQFSDAGLEVDLFDLLAGAIGGAAGSPGSAGEVDLDLEIGFRLKRVAVSLGSLDPAQSTRFSFAIIAGIDFAGLSADVSLSFSDQELSIGFDQLSIPIALPQLPMSRNDLDALRDPNGHWDVAVWQQIEQTIDVSLNNDTAALTQARHELELLQANPAADAGYAQQLFELRSRVIPEIQKRVFHHTGNKFLTGAVMAIHEALGAISGATSQTTYQSLVELYQNAVDATVGSLHFDTHLQFVIVDARFVLPFDDPANIRVEGGASLQGFAPDDPLKPMEELVFKLGLSADAIYFSVEGGADPIPLPDFGRYPGNGIVFDRLLIGYGYNKNSLLVDFAGELQLSPALVEDVDTSSRLGVGLRLPTTSRLKFKIDLIPIVLGEVDFLLPLIAFDIDLRSENPPSAPVSEQCAPAWDGLQFHAPGIVRADFKRAKVAPFFGPLPAPNYLYSFDIEIGNDALGLTQICENYQVILGVVPIPFLTDATPFFDRFCTNLRLAGFGINFDLRRPFPHPNPLMIFELLGFLSDPSLPIDPAGHLADIMWAELRNTRITLPPAVLGMFPEQGHAISRELNVRINVGTVITMAQQLKAVAGNLEQGLSQAGSDIGSLIQALAQQPPQALVGELLAQLPRELRRVELNGSFVGFDASAIFLLTTPADLHEQMRPTPPGTPPGAPSTHWVNVVHDKFSRSPLLGWKTIDYGLKGGQVGDWRVSQGRLVQKNNVGDNSAGRYGAALVRETDPLSDLRIRVELQSDDNDGIGVLFHVQDASTYYRFRMTSEQHEWRLMRLKKGVTRVLHQSKSAFIVDRLYRVQIEARSVAQRSAVLPALFDARNLGRVANRRRAGSATKQRYTTHIRIWVDGALWCDIADADLPLIEGQAGLDSWWNSGARFSNFIVDRAQRAPSDALHLDPRAVAHDLVPLTTRASVALPATTQTASWLTEDLTGFSDEDLMQAIPDNGVSAVVVAARVNLLDSQVYRLIGVMQADGEFRLLSSISVAPLTLSVAGMEIQFPLNVEGRITLEGRSAGADSWARFSVGLYGDWEALPVTGGDALARLVIGSQSQPVQLIADSRGHFHLQGDGELRLFGDQIELEGSLDISEQHALIRGSFEFAPDLRVSTNLRVMELTLEAEGRIGPGHDFHLAGHGTLALLGKTFSEVSASLSPQGLTLETRLAADSAAWQIKGFSLSEVEMALRGHVGFDGALPALSLEGRGHLSIAGARVAGQCRINADADSWCLGATGSVDWQGNHWLQGGVELCDDRLTVQGQAQFVLNLTQTELPGNIQIAGLFLTARIGGSFSVRASGRLAACHFDLDWTLAIRLPGSEPSQSLPIATQRLHVGQSAIPANLSNVTLADLIQIDGIKLFDLEGMLLPLPTVSPTESADFYLHQSIPVDLPALTLPIPILTTNPGPANALNDAGPLPFTYWETPGIDIQAFDLPIPFLSDSAPAAGASQDPLFSLPKIVIEEVPLSGAIELSDLVLGLQLSWRNGKLGIWIIQTQQFYAFGTLP